MSNAVEIVGYIVCVLMMLAGAFVYFDATVNDPPRWPRGMRRLAGLMIMVFGFVLLLALIGVIPIAERF